MGICDWSPRPLDVNKLLCKVRNVRLSECVSTYRGNCFSILNQAAYYLAKDINASHYESKLTELGFHNIWFCELP